MTSTAEKWYDENLMVSEPPVPCDFKVGDLAKFTNEYGVEFGPYTILGYTRPEDVLHGRFIHVNSDSPWFPVKPEQLTRWPEMRIFELTFDGFDPLRSDTDHLVKWISAESETILNRWLKGESLQKIFSLKLSRGIREIRDITDQTRISREFLVSQNSEIGIDLWLKVLDGVICVDGDYSRFWSSING